jgi:hypothetical protein
LPLGLDGVKFEYEIFLLIDLHSLAAIFLQTSTIFRIIPDYKKEHTLVLFRIAKIVLILVLFTGEVYGEVPRVMNYQGVLKTSSDSLVTGTISVKFFIYDSATGGSELWSESHTIEALEGQFHTLLGGSTPFPVELFAAPNRFLTFAINEGEELQPRQQIVSVAYAIESSSSDTAAFSQKSAQADDVNDRDISPRSVSLSGGKASLDSSGLFTATTARIDSLVVGPTGVIDRFGNWTGRPINLSLEGMVLDTVIVKNVRNTLEIAGGSRWKPIKEFETYIRLDSPGMLDLAFNGVVTVQGGLETRLVIEGIVNGTPKNRQENQSNVSGILTDGSDVYRSSAVSNSAVYYLENGFYRINVEKRINGRNPTLNTATLLMKIFARP